MTEDEWHALGLTHHYCLMLLNQHKLSDLFLVLSGSDDWSIAMKNGTYGCTLLTTNYFTREKAEAILLTLTLANGG